MGATLSRKGKKGKKPQEDPPRETEHEGSDEPQWEQQDVVLIVDKHKFRCDKKDLYHHSNYFRGMLSANFTEANKAEIELPLPVDRAVFQKFLDAINGQVVIKDKNVEKSLELADFLESSTLERACMLHLARTSKISLQEQFLMAEKHNSQDLMAQICSSIQDAHQMDEVVPKSLNSFSNNTKNLVLQRSFELLGIRKPPTKPLPSEPVQIFELMMDELISQAELQNDHGLILKDQALLIHWHMNIVVKRLRPKFRDAWIMTQNDPRTIALENELRNSHSPIERNAVRAQMLVIGMKNRYTCEAWKNTNQERSRNFIICLLKLFNKIVQRDKRYSVSQIALEGDKPIDDIYRRIVANGEEPTILEDFNDGTRPWWINQIIVQSKCLAEKIVDPQSPVVPPDVRMLSSSASFEGLTDLVQNLRHKFYEVERKNSRKEKAGNQAQHD